MSSLFSGWEDAKGEGQAAQTSDSPSVYTEMRLRVSSSSSSSSSNGSSISSISKSSTNESSSSRNNNNNSSSGSGFCARCMDMRKRAGTPQEVTLRWYNEPQEIKDTCILYYRDQGVLVGGLHARRAAETAKVICTQTTQAMRGVLKALGFRYNE
ncbi:hypothetical protein, conserved [Eimeria maxima]|uniref:Uncharacterized protein n=1 Tax=Eimeria maxima TaxID=5804 RepID=U6MC91_EIMMA|nr:hypothetical protein, conserved [Eimeria maxima]CDJ60678.1 hypothetical protein, conserved [Eimeria maxima]